MASKARAHTISPGAPAGSGAGGTNRASPSGAASMPSGSVASTAVVTAEPESWLDPPSLPQPTATVRRAPATAKPVRPRVRMGMPGRGHRLSPRDARVLAARALHRGRAVVARRSPAGWEEKGGCVTAMAMAQAPMRSAFESIGWCACTRSVDAARGSCLPFAPLGETGGRPMAGRRRGVGALGVVVAWIGLMAWAPPAGAAAGDLDATFSGDGRQTTNLTGGFDPGFAVDV